MNAQRSDVRTGLARDPEYDEVALGIKLNEFALVNGADAQLALNGGDERRALKQGSGQRFDGSGNLGQTTLLRYQIQ